MAATPRHRPARQDRRRRQRHLVRRNDGKGKYGTFTVDQTGKWTYNLDPANTSVKELKTGESIETFTVYVDDGKGGRPRDHHRQDQRPTAPSSPSKPGDDAGSVKEDDKLTTGGKLDVVDPDKGEAVFKPRPTSRAIAASSRSMPTATGYELDNNDPKVQALGVGEKLVETFEVVTADGTRYRHRHDQWHQRRPGHQRPASGEVTDGGNTSATGQLGKTDVDVNDTLVRQQRRQGQVRHLHRRPDRQVDL